MTDHSVGSFRESLDSREVKPNPDCATAQEAEMHARGRTVITGNPIPENEKEVQIHWKDGTPKIWVDPAKEYRCATGVVIDRAHCVMSLAAGIAVARGEKVFLYRGGALHGVARPKTIFIQEFAIIGFALAHEEWSKWKSQLQTYIKPEQREEVLFATSYHFLIAGQGGPLRLILR